MYVTPYGIAQRFVGMKEVPGSEDNPGILHMLRLDADWPEHDEVPWCSAFLNYVCHILGLDRSRSLRARSWLDVGVPIASLDDASPGFDVVILNRADGPQDPNIIDAPGHVGFYAGHKDNVVQILGGNQGNQVSIKEYPRNKILGIRRLAA